jgi:hypothetical protein
LEFLLYVRDGKTLNVETFPCQFPLSVYLIQIYALSLVGFEVSYPRNYCLSMRTIPRDQVGTGFLLEIMKTREGKLWTNSISASFSRTC